MIVATILSLIGTGFISTVQEFVKFIDATLQHQIKINEDRTQKVVAIFP